MITPEIKAQVIERLGKKSFGIIARELGLTRNQVASLSRRMNPAVRGAPPRNAPERLYGPRPVKQFQISMPVAFSENDGTAIREMAKSRNMSVGALIREVMGAYIRRG